MFLSDDGNTAVFPMPSGDFNIEEMTSRTHFEVNGDGIAAIPTVPQSPGDNGLALAPVVQLLRDMIVDFFRESHHMAMSFCQISDNLRKSIPTPDKRSEPRSACTNQLASRWTKKRKTSGAAVAFRFSFWCSKTNNGLLYRFSFSHLY